MIKFKITKLCIVFLLAFQTGAAFSKTDSTFIIGVEKFDKNLPYSEIKGGKYQGFNREILDLFAKSKGYTFIYKATPIKRLFGDFLNGKVDFKYPDNPHWIDLKDKNIKIIYSEPVVKYIDGLMVTPTNMNKSVNSLKKLGTIAGFTPYPYLDLINAGSIQVKESNNINDLIKKTIAKRVDAAYVNIAVSKYYLSKNPKITNGLKFNPNLPHSKSARYLSSILHPEIIDEFNLFLLQNIDALDTMKLKYRVEDGIN